MSRWTVARCFIDPAAFGLLVDGGTGDILRVYIQGRFTLQDEGGRVQTFLAENDPMTLAPLLVLMGRAVKRTFVSRGGDLAIDFEGGSSIRVPPDAEDEAWEIEGLGRLMLICLPGGEGPAGIWE